MNTLNLVASWNTFWGTVSGAISTPVQTMLTVVGIGLIVFTVVKFLWDKRRGGSAKSSPVWWTLIFGGVLIAPGFLIPIVLSVLQVAINFGSKMLGGIFPS